MISGPNRDELVVLAFPNLVEVRKIVTDVAPDASVAETLASARLRTHVADILARLSERGSGSATRIARVVFMTEPASLDAGELTDKGSLNARTILTRRAAIADDAHAQTPLQNVIIAPQPV